jgi:hypothetical protein
MRRALVSWLCLCAGCFDFASLRERMLDMAVADHDDLAMPSPDMTVTRVAACPATITGGTHLNTAHFPGSPSQLALSGANLAGFFESEVFDNLEPRAWKTISWVTQRPYGKPLPGGRVNETGYASGNASMGDNVLLLRFDEAFASSMFGDASGRNHPAACVTGPTCPVAGGVGRFRRGARFDGVNDMLRANDHPDFETDQVTLETWVRVLGPPGGNASTLISKGNQMVPPFTSWALEIDSPSAPDTMLRNRPRCYMPHRAPTDMTQAVEITVHATTALPQDSGWHHVACTFDQNMVRVYVDGTEEGFRAVPAGSTLIYGMAVNDDLHLAAFGGSFQFFNGELDELAIHDRALSGSEIGDHYRRGALRVGLQMRSCDDASCTAKPFVGPTANPGSYYTEACVLRADGTATMDLNHLDCDGDGNPDDSPQSAAPPSRYLQYRVQLDSDRLAQTPDVRAVSFCP